MDGSVACVARRLASSALRRQMSLSDDIRGGSSNAPNQVAHPLPGCDGPSRARGGPGRLSAPLRSAHLFEDQFAMLLEYAEALFKRMEQ